MRNVTLTLLAAFLSPVIFGLSALLLVEFEFGPLFVLGGFVVSVLPVLWMLYQIVFASPKAPVANDSYSPKAKRKDVGYFLILLIVFSLVVLVDIVIGYGVLGYWIVNHYSP
jgi:hypothetical protein